MQDIIDCGNGFWNFRGSFRIGGLLDIGTQASLVRMGDGSFTFLDSYTLSGEQLAAVHEISGDRVTRVINTHPFHTLHTEAMFAAFPKAAHHGTARHRARFPDLPWAEANSEDPALWAALADDLAFSIPAGLDFIPANEHVHSSSILVRHRASGAVHVDDTFGWRAAKGRRRGRLSVHPMLRFALEKRPGAAADFRAWGRDLTARWSEIPWLCTAHNGALSAADLTGGKSIPEAMQAALAAVEPTLARHEKRWG